ncbi:cytoskeleton-associated protein 2 isoform X2 [Tiliqua scincoides]
MEDKENANRDAWNQLDSILENQLASPKALKSPVVLKQTTIPTNRSPLTNIPAVETEPAEIKNLHMSFSQTFLLKRSTKEKQLKSATQNSGPHLSEKHVLGTYRGKVVSSKINSFRKKTGNEAGKKPLTDAPKSAVKTGSISNSINMRDSKTTNIVSASKAVVIASLQTRPPVRVSVSRPKPILNREKQPINSISMNKGTVQKKPGTTCTPLLKTVLCKTYNSVPRTKETVPPKTVARHVSEMHGTGPLLVSKSIDNRRTLPVSAEVRRAQLAEWKVSKGKGVKKVPAPISADTQPEIEAQQQTVKEPVKSFWAAIAEEDEQGLFKDTVDKTLKECLHSIKEGCPGDSIDSILEELILKFPDAKKFAKYWVCRMRLEQCRSTEKIIAIYEEAILAEAQPKNELRHALADIMKDTKDQPKSNGECAKKEIVLNDMGEANLDDKLADTFTEIDLKKMESSNEETSQKAAEETSQKAAEVCLKSEQETCPSVRKNKNKEQSQKPTVCKKEEQCGGSADIDEILETPEKEREDSYMIKYNVSTTPYLESMKKKLQCDANDSAVKDLKFLTPVRRSRRIQEKENKLPKMLKDHNPCVTSLEQLGELGEETNVFIYRQNSALSKAIDHPEEQCKE